MAGQASSGIHRKPAAGDPVFNARVSYPITDKSSREIRDNILIDFFGYSEADIAALDVQKKGYFYISDKASSSEWATGAQVKLWNFNPDRTVRIRMPQTLIDKLTAFPGQRASLEIFKVGMFIADAETRRLITEALENIFSSSGDKRTAALDNLMLTISGSQASRGEVFQALRFLTNESGYKNNPFLLLAFAATTSFRSETPSFGSDEVSQEKIATAVRAANESLYNNRSKSAQAKISAQEAAKINQWASILYDGVNANDKATNRRWIERFLSMSDAERSSLKEGSIISINRPDVTQIRGQFPSEQRLKNATQEFTEQNQRWSEIDKIGKDQSFDLKGDHRQTEYFQKNSDLYPSGSKIVPANDAAHSLQVAPDKFKTVYSNVNVDGASAPIGIFLEYAKWRTANERMKVITAYLNKKSQLKARIRQDTQHIVPPSPQVVEQYIKDFRRDGSITVNPFEKTKIKLTQS
jgi:hypothetical protein